MERYDFRDCVEGRDEIALKMDSLNNQEWQSVREEMDTLIENEKEKTMARKRAQFETVFLPILITFAENMSALLEVDQRDDGIVRVTLRNRYGFEITESERLVKLMLMSAVLMTIEQESGEIVIRLVFDCHVFGV